MIFCAATSHPHNEQLFQAQKRFDLALPALAIEIRYWTTSVLSADLISGRQCRPWISRIFSICSSKAGRHCPIIGSMKSGIGEFRRHYLFNSQVSTLYSSLYIFTIFSPLLSLLLLLREFSRMNHWRSMCS